MNTGANGNMRMFEKEAEWVSEELMAGDLSPEEIASLVSYSTSELTEKNIENIVENEESHDDAVDDSVSIHYNDFEHEFLASLEKRVQEDCRIRLEQREMRMIGMRPLFINHPKLESICKGYENDFVDSDFKKYTFQNDHLSPKNFDEDADDLRYTLTVCGYILTELDIQSYHSSEIMILIDRNCTNLKSLSFGFKEIESKHFDNVFSKMSHLEHLAIEWECENSNIPVTLANSLLKVNGTLKTLNLLNCLKKKHVFLPDSLISIFPQLIALEKLSVHDFDLSQSLVQSISELNNLIDFKFLAYWGNNNPVFCKNINMHSLKNLKNLETLEIRCECVVTDKLFINFGVNKKLKNLSVFGTNITDDGIAVLNNFKQLEKFDLGLSKLKKNNTLITDKSIKWLFNKKLTYLNISNCTNITSSAVIKLFENLSNLKQVYIENTKASYIIVQKIVRLANHRIAPLHIHVSFKDPNGLLKLANQSDKVNFYQNLTHKIIINKN